MSFEHRPSPSRVTEAAAATFPRWLLFALLAVYIVPGLFGRAPWSPEDASAFGVAWSMAAGSSLDWWLPAVAGEPLPEEGPLPFWIGALFVRLLGPWLGDVTAARLVTVLWFAIGTWALWYATYRLARRDEAQPVALAFGGEATPRNYGRMLADVAVLLLDGHVRRAGAHPRNRRRVRLAGAGVCAALRACLLTRRSVEGNGRRRRRARRHRADARVVARRRAVAGCHRLHRRLRRAPHRARDTDRAACIRGLLALADRRSPGPSAAGRNLSCRLVALEQRQCRHPTGREPAVARPQCRLVRLALVAVCPLDDLLLAPFPASPAHGPAAARRRSRARRRAAVNRAE